MLAIVALGPASYLGDRDIMAANYTALIGDLFVSPWRSEERYPVIYLGCIQNAEVLFLPTSRIVRSILLQHGDHLIQRVKEPADSGTTRP